MIPRRVKYQCPQCNMQETHTEGCIYMPRYCSKCDLPLEIKSVCYNQKQIKFEEILEKFFNLFR